MLRIDYRSVASQNSSLDSDEAFPFDNKDKEPWSNLVKLSLTETVASFQVCTALDIIKNCYKFINIYFHLCFRLWKRKMKKLSPVLNY